jgi:hypothetical protein
MKKAVVAGAGIVIALGIAPGAALAAHSNPSTAKKIHMTASPTKNVKPGTTIHVKGSGAGKGAYYCALTVLNKSDPTGDYVADAKGLKVVNSKHGKLKCNIKFAKFKGVSSGTATQVGCPVAKKLSKKWSCAVNLADKKHQGQAYAGTVFFTGKG